MRSNNCKHIYTADVTPRLQTVSGFKFGIIQESASIKAPVSDLSSCHILASQNPLCAFTPPHHQGGHEQRDQHGHRDERSEDADWWIVEEPPGEGAVVEEDLVDLHEEAVHDLIGPEAVQLQRDLEGAVCEILVDLLGVWPAAPQAPVNSCHDESELSEAEIIDQLLVEAPAADRR